MKKKSNNYAYIDGANLHNGIIGFGWKLDYARFRVWLSEKYTVKNAYIFIGLIPKYKDLYKYLQECGFTLIFKEVIYDGDGKPKGNCDADLVLRAMVEYPNYERAVIVTGDGDYYSLIDYLKSQDKLEQVLIPDEKRYSALLKKVNNEHLKYISFISRMRSKLEYLPEP